MALTVREAARVLRVDEAQVYRWLDAGEIPSYTVHGQPRFDRAELLEWATSRKLPVAVDVFQTGHADAQPGPGLVEALRAAGVPEDNICSLDLCTYCDRARFYSHRRDGRARGSHWALICLP